MTARTVSFVIPVRDDAARLKRCLASILRNEYPASLLELVVVDNGSRDGSDRVAREAGALLLSCPGASVSELRNRGAAAARGEVLAFVDADHEIFTDFAVDTRDLVAIGEVGLSGEVRRVSRLDSRLQEGAALGLERALVPPMSAINRGIMLLG